MLRRSQPASWFPSWSPGKYLDTEMRQTSRLQLSPSCQISRLPPQSPTARRCCLFVARQLTGCLPCCNDSQLFSSSLPHPTRHTLTVLSSPAVATSNSLPSVLSPLLSFGFFLSGLCRPLRLSP